MHVYSSEKLYLKNKSLKSEDRPVGAEAGPVVCNARSRAQRITGILPVTHIDVPSGSLIVMEFSTCFLTSDINSKSTCRVEV